MTFKEIVYDWGGYNAEIFYAINGLGHAGLQTAMTYISMFGHPRIFILYIIIISAYACYDARVRLKNPKITTKQKEWLKVVTVLILAYYIDLIWVHILKVYIYLPRPALILPTGTVHQLVSESHYSSFPSGHTCFAMLMAAGLWPVLNKFGKACAIIYVSIIALSRIILGVHFPADVVIGAGLSLLSVLIVRKIIEKTVAKKKPS